MLCVCAVLPACTGQGHNDVINGLAFALDADGVNFQLATACDDNTVSDLLCECPASSRRENRASSHVPTHPVRLPPPVRRHQVHPQRRSTHSDCEQRVT
jgi:hypothetical protein